MLNLNHLAMYGFRQCLYSFLVLVLLENYLFVLFMEYFLVFQMFGYKYFLISHFVLLTFEVHCSFSI